MEETARALGLTEDKVRQICLEHERDILRRMKTSAEDAIREFAYDEGLIPLGEPEIPEPVKMAAIRFTEPNEEIFRIPKIGRVLRPVDSSET